MHLILNPLGSIPNLAESKDAYSNFSCLIAQNAGPLDLCLYTCWVFHIILDTYVIRYFDVNALVQKFFFELGWLAYITTLWMIHIPSSMPPFCFCCCVFCCPSIQHLTIPQNLPPSGLHFLPLFYLFIFPIVVCLRPHRLRFGTPWSCPCIRNL